MRARVVEDGEGDTWIRVSEKMWLLLYDVPDIPKTLRWGSTFDEIEDYYSPVRVVLEDPPISHEARGAAVAEALKAYSSNLDAPDSDSAAVIAAVDAALASLDIEVASSE